MTLLPLQLHPASGSFSRLRKMCFASRHIFLCAPRHTLSRASRHISSVCAHNKIVHGSRHKSQSQLKIKRCIGPHTATHIIACTKSWIFNFYS